MATSVWADVGSHVVGDEPRPRQSRASRPPYLAARPCAAILIGKADTGLTAQIDASSVGSAVADAEPLYSRHNRYRWMCSKRSPYGRTLSAGDFSEIVSRVIRCG